MSGLSKCDICGKRCKENTEGDRRYCQGHPQSEVRKWCAAHPDHAVKRLNEMLKGKR